LLSVFSTWHLLGEQYRFDAVNDKYKELRGTYLPKTENGTCRGKILGVRMGRVMIWFYGIAFSLISIVDGFALFKTVGLSKV